MISNTTIARCCTVHQICRTGHYVVRDTHDWKLKICRTGHIWLNTVRGNRGGHVPYDILCRTGQICSLFFRYKIIFLVFIFCIIVLLVEWIKRFISVHIVTPCNGIGDKLINLKYVVRDKKMQNLI